MGAKQSCPGGTTQYTNSIESIKQVFPSATCPINWAAEDSVYSHSIVNTLENAEYFRQSAAATRPARCGCVPMLRRFASPAVPKQHESKSASRICKQVSWAQIAFFRRDIPRSWLDVDGDKQAHAQFSPQRVPTEMPAWLPVTSFISREWLGEDDALEHKNIDAAKSEFETELTDTSTTLSKYHAPPVGPSNTLWNRGREGVGGERSTGTELDSHRPISPSTSSSNCHSLDATLVRNSGINFKAPHGRVSCPSPPRTPALDKISFAPSLPKMELECNTVTRDFMDSLKECSPTCGQGSSRDDADGMAELLSMCDILTHGLRDEETWGAGESQTTDINNVGLHMIIEDSGLFEKIPQIAFEHLGRTDDMCDLLTFGGTCPPLGA
mmetsp:Transcript_32853/g.27780  ORF Transcript_32853/g.27780 Transcript_32853/m.27780 type:complete len:383 (+) Transcript_32853:141-1289(+)